MVKKIISLIFMILPFVLYSQEYNPKLEDKIQLDIELLKDSLRFGDLLEFKIKYKNISNNQVNICIPSILFVTEALEELFQHGFDVMILNKEMKGDIKELTPNEEVILYYKIILEKLDFLHIGNNRLILNYIYVTKHKKKKIIEGYIQKSFDLYIRG